jgi:TolA-binding protein
MPAAFERVGEMSLEGAKVRPMGSVVRRVVQSVLFAGLLGLAAVVAAQEKTESSEEAKQSYADAANLQNNGAFDVAALEWQKFLKNHPKDPLAAKAQHYLGICQLQLKQHEQSAASFAAVIANFPKFELLEDTYLNLGASQYALAVGGNKEMYAPAAQTFATLVKQFPKSKHAGEALFFQGESLYALGKKEEAAAAYDALLKADEKSPRRREVLYALGVTREELKQYAEAGKIYDQYLKEVSEGPLVAEVRMRKGETLLQTGDVAAAEKLFAEAAATEGFRLADHALFQQALCQARQEKFEQAAALYAKVVTTYPQSSYVPDATMLAGTSFYRAGKLDDAATWLARSAGGGTKSSPEAAHWLCKIHLKQKKFAEAFDLATKALPTAADSPFLVHLKLDQADAQFELPDRRGQSLPLYAKIADEHPQHELAPQARYNAAFAALELKNYDDGLKQAGAFVAAYPQNVLLPDAKYVAAECSLQLKKYAEAEKLFADLAARHPEHADADAWRVRQGLVSFVQKKYPETIAILEPIVASLKKPDTLAEAQFLIGASRFFTDKLDAAAQALSASLKANPQWRQADEAVLLLARAQHKLGKTAEAKAAIAQLLAEFPHSGHLDQAHYRLGEFAFAAGDYKGALAEYETVASKFPQSPFASYAIYGTGWSQLQAKEYPAAVESFTKMLTDHPQHPLALDAYRGRGLARRQAGQFADAIADFDAFLKSNPEVTRKCDILYERGQCQLALKKFAEAAATFGEVIKVDPKYAGMDKVLYEIGWAFKSQDKHADAVPYFASLAGNHADSPLAAEASFHVGEDRYDKKEFAEAAKFYAACRAKNPTGDLGEKAAYKLGWAHFQQKQYGEALQQFSDQVANFGSGPLAADGIFMKAECLFKLEKFQEAFPAYQAAAKTKASSPTIEVLTLLHGGQSAAQLKQWTDAIGLLEQVPERYPQTPLLAEAHYELGWARQNAGQTEDALKEFEIAGTKSRDHVGARARFMMGEVYFSQKQHTEAIREFQRAMFGYGGEQASAETKNWQAKSGYDAGRCAEVQIATADAAAKPKLIADAKRFYTFVVEKHPQHELAAEAKKRLDVLSKL